jgi:hypothetical protein
LPEKGKRSFSNQVNWAWIVAALFALAWVTTLILWGWQKRTKSTNKGSYKNALAHLQNACTQGDPQRARDALLKWARLHWPDASILNLTDLSHLTTDASFKKQVQLLSQILYKDQEKTFWRGDELWRSVHMIKKANKQSKGKNPVLPPMNPLS